MSSAGQNTSFTSSTTAYSGIVNEVRDAGEMTRDVCNALVIAPARR